MGDSRYSGRDALHELGVAVEICRIARARLAVKDLPLVRAVGVEVGADSGVEPSGLELCLEALLAAPPFGGARPRIERVEGDELRVTYLEVDDGGPDDRGP